MGALGTRMPGRRDQANIDGLLECSIRIALGILLPTSFLFVRTQLFLNLPLISLQYVTLRRLSISTERKCIGVTHDLLSCDNLLVQVFQGLFV